MTVQNAQEEKPPSMDMLMWFTCMLVPLFLAWAVAMLKPIIQDAQSLWKSSETNNWIDKHQSTIFILAHVGLIEILRQIWRLVGWLRHKRRSSLPIHNRLLFKLDNIRRYLWKRLIRFSLTKSRFSRRKRPVLAEHVFQDEERLQQDDNDHPSSEAYYHHILTTYGSWMTFVNPSLNDKLTVQWCQELVVLALSPHWKNLRRFKRRQAQRRLLRSHQSNQPDPFKCSQDQALHLRLLGPEAEEIGNHLRAFRDTQIRDIMQACRASKVTPLPTVHMEIVNNVEYTLDSQQLGRMLLEGGLGLFVLCPPPASDDNALDYTRCMTQQLHSKILPHMMFRNSGAIMHLNVVEPKESPIVCQAAQAFFNQLIRSMYYEYRVHGIDCFSVTPQPHQSAKKMLHKSLILLGKQAEY